MNNKPLHRWQTYKIPQVQPHLIHKKGEQYQTMSPVSPRTQNDCEKDQESVSFSAAITSYVRAQNGKYSNRHLAEDASADDMARLQLESMSFSC